MIIEMRRNQMIIFLIFFLFFSKLSYQNSNFPFLSGFNIGISAYAEDFQSQEKIISIQTLEKGIIDSLSKVQEFREIKKLAEEIGISGVYLFGGTASSYAHYVYWDLEQKAGLTRFFPLFFDYHMDSIFRPGQYIDIVLDTEDESKISLFQKQISDRYPYFKGNRGTWEVSSLTRGRNNQMALLEKDFLNQNTDSHSIGLIELTGNSDVRILSLKEWETRDNQFLKDVYNRELHYYYNPVEHRKTPKYIQGENPEIFSVIRFLIKAFQFELKIDKESLENIRQVISEFDSNRDLPNSYTQLWVEENVKNLYKYAGDIEYAYAVMSDLKLLAILKNIKNNYDQEGSLAWWMNKMPLPSFPIGETSKDEGVKTAEDLKIGRVFHGTNSIEAYRAILGANLFMSRPDHVGEAAVHGPGFYVTVGEPKETSAYKYAIIFDVNHKAAEGVDFIRANYNQAKNEEPQDLAILNKSILTVVQDQFQHDFRWYASVEELENTFRKLLWGQIEPLNTGLQERLKIKFERFFINLETEEKEHIIKVIKEEVVGKVIDRAELPPYFDEFHLLWEFAFSLLFDRDPNLLKRLIIDKKHLHLFIARFILSHSPHPPHRGEDLELLARLIERGNQQVLFFITDHFFLKNHWSGHPKFLRLAHTLIKRGDQEVLREIVLSLAVSDWKEYPEFPKLINMVIEKGNKEVLSFIEKTLLEELSEIDLLKSSLKMAKADLKLLFLEALQKTRLKINDLRTYCVNLIKH